MTTRVVVLADTHMPRRAKELPRRLLAELADADLAIHLGDFTQIEVAEALEQYVALVGVHGNNDREEVRLRFPSRRRLELDGYSLVLLHGDIGGRTALQAALAEPSADAVLFGHSHRPYLQRHAERLLFNPGSPTDRRWGPYCSFGILRLGETIEGELILLD